MKFCLPYRFLLFSIAFQSQLYAQGKFSFNLLPGNVIHIHWEKPGMARAEAMGDAILAKPKNLPKPLVNVVETSSGLMIAPEGGGLSVSWGKHRVSITEAFDSGHVRGFKIKMPANAPWYGGGERSLPMNRVGQRIPLYNNPHYGYELNADELNYSMPFVLNLQGYGLLFDNPARGYFDFGKTTPGTLEAGFVSGALDMYILPGETPDDIVQAYASLTGLQPLPPRWALGNFVSRFGYRSQAQAEAVVGAMKKENFPVEAVIIDIFWFGDSIKGTLGNLDFVNKAKWPAPYKMISDFKKQGVNTILVTEPFFLKGTRQFNASLPYLAKDSAGKPFMLTDFYFGYGGLLDLFRPDARQWFWTHYKKFSDRGVAGWWGDLGEPEKHPAGIYHDLSSMGIKRPVAADEIHNMYGHMWSKMLYENWRRTYPGKRLFYLNRAGYAGSQRYSVFPWTGDVSRSWNGLKAQLPILQSMSLSGIPYIHSDAGGFSNAPISDQELYVRWLQMAGFTPVFRPHGTAFGDLEPGVNDIPSEPVFKDEPYKSIARKVINLRYQLLPYHYNLAWEASTKGRPFIRPMMYFGAADSNLTMATDQYMYGDAFLIAPITDAGAKTRRLYLPKGPWYRMTDNSLAEGPQWIKDSVTLESMPVYIKGGSFVPHWDAMEYRNTGEYNVSSPLTIRYYPASIASETFTYEDDGQDPTALKDAKKHQVLEWHGVAGTSGATISVNAVNWQEGNTRKIYLELPVKEYTKRILPYDKPIGSISINGKITPVSNRMLNYPGAAWQVIEFNFDGRPVLVEIKW